MDNLIVPPDKTIEDSAVVKLPKETTALSTDPKIMREQILEREYDGDKNLIQHLRRKGMTDADSLIDALIEEMSQEADNLKANGEISLQAGDLQSNTLIASKRIDALKETAKIVQAKKAFEHDAGMIDLNSPAVKVLIKYFMSRCKLSMVNVGIQPDVNDLFFKELSSQLLNWQKEVKSLLEEMRRSGGQR